MGKSNKKIGRLTPKVILNKDYKVICVNPETKESWIEAELPTFNDAKTLIDINTLPNVEYYVLFKDSNRVLYKKEG